MRAHLEYISLSEDGLFTGNVAAPSGQSGLSRYLFGSAFVISRGLCSFESRRLNPNMTKGESRRALHLHALAASPFQNPGVFIRLGRDFGSIWTWDKDVLAEKKLKANHKVIPETAMQAHADGLYLVTCLDGYEGQVWQDRQLVMSQWWPEPIDENDWALFCHAAENHNVAPIRLPDAIRQNYAKTSIPVNESPVGALLGEVSLSQWAVAVACLLLLPALYLGVRFPYLLHLQSQKQAEYASLWQEKSSLRAERSELNTQLAETRILSELMNYTHPLPPITLVVSALSDLNVRFEKIDYSDGVVEINFQTNETISQTELVRQFEAADAIRDVTLTSDTRANRWILTFSIEASTGGPV